MTFDPSTIGRHAASAPQPIGSLGNEFDPFIFMDANFATMLECDPDDSGFGHVRDGAIVISAGKIVWLGPKEDIPQSFRRLPSCSAGGRLVTPGLVECHSHLIFAGDRHSDFGLRAAGAEYSELVWNGKGILSTVEATRKASEDELYESALRRLHWFKKHGVTTIEVKSGYGLDVETELKMLRVADRLSKAGVANVHRTLLAGHVYPPGIDPEQFVESICLELIPEAHILGLCDSIEVYCDECLGLSLDDTSTILETAYRLKIPTRLATDHLTDSAGAALAPAFYAKAAAHLNYSDELDLEALVRARTVPILLPVTHLELGSKQVPNVEKLRECGSPIALSTGFNPGTSPCPDPLTAAHLACVLYGMSPLEALRGVTTCAAQALGLGDDVGILNPGSSADFAVWDAEHPEDLIYWFHAPLCRSVWSAQSENRSHAVAN